MMFGEWGTRDHDASIKIIHRALDAGINSAIIGPRTMEHLDSQLTAACAVASDDVLDRIDEIVPPGITLNPADNG